MASRPLSLNVRLLIGASVVLIAFLGATAFALDVAFRESAASAARDRLQGHVYTLLAAANVDIDGALVVPDSVPEPRFSRPGSGLYAQIHGKDFQWQSESLLGVRTEIPGNDMGPGELRFAGPDRAGDEELFVFQQGVAWELDDGSERGFTFSAAESSQAYRGQIRGFRQALWGWLGAATIVLLAVQGSILRWGLGPLREIASELRLVEQGEKERITGRYPRELAGLSENLNAFIGSERRHLGRFRNSLADLAHSLKTPLAVIRSGLDSPSVGEKTRKGIGEQVDRMDDIVAYQLKRGSASGHLILARPVDVHESIAPIVRSLHKLHGDGPVHCEMAVDPGTRFFGDQGDLMEVVGNLLENAFKWAGKRIEISVSQLAGANERRPGLLLIVDDDGPGIAEDQAREVLKRGVRADERVAGHGLGLALVGEILAAYDGRIEIQRSHLGGASIRVTFPPQTPHL